MPTNPVAIMAWSPGGDHLIGGDQDRLLFVCRFDSEWLAVWPVRRDRRQTTASGLPGEPVAPLIGSVEKMNANL